MDAEHFERLVDDVTRFTARWARDAGPAARAD
jgi:hypothetical protein